MESQSHLLFQSNLFQINEFYHSVIELRKIDDHNNRTMDLAPVEIANNEFYSKLKVIHISYSNHSKRNGIKL